MAIVTPDLRLADIDHPTLSRARYMLEAADRLFATAPHPGIRILVSIESVDGDWETNVSFMNGPDEDDLDDMPGVRRIERRARDMVPFLQSPSSNAWATMKMCRTGVSLETSDDSMFVIGSHADSGQDGWLCRDELSMAVGDIPLMDVAGPVEAFYDTWVAPRLTPARTTGTRPTDKTTSQERVLRIALRFDPGTFTCREDLLLQGAVEEEDQS